VNHVLVLISRVRRGGRLEDRIAGLDVVGEVGLERHEILEERCERVDGNESSNHAHRRLGPAEEPSPIVEGKPEEMRHGLNRQGLGEHSHDIEPLPSFAQERLRSRTKPLLEFLHPAGREGAREQLSVPSVNLAIG